MLWSIYKEKKYPREGRARKHFIMDFQGRKGYLRKFNPDSSLFTEKIKPRKDK